MKLVGTGLVLAAVSVPLLPALAQQQLVTIDGSSTVYPVTEAVAEEFMNSVRGSIKVTVGVSGTGGGFKKFVRGETDISDASRPILESEMKAALENGIEYLELPVCFDALTVAVNPKNDWCSSITVEELKKIWEPSAQGQILRWNQIRADWPAEKIQLFGPGPDSGTFDYFTEAVVGKAKSSRGDYTGSEDDHIIVRGIEGSRYSLGYVGFSYYAENKGKLKALAIDWEKDQLGAIEPNAENVLKGVYNPLSRPLFIYVNKKSLETKPYVRQFVEYYLANAAELATEVKVMPLPESSYPLVLQRLQKMQAGTAFGGEPTVGIHIDEILKREPTLKVKATEAGAKLEPGK